MKKTLLLIFLVLGIQVLTAQNKYDKLWNEVEHYELQGKFKSASEIVNKIFKKANRNNNSDQIIKGFIYKSKFALLLEENAQRNIISEIEGSIKNTAFPTNAILESIYAGFLNQYLIKNRYKISQRTKINSQNPITDFEKWDVNTLVAEIAMHYNNSISNEIELKKHSIEDFKEMLTHSNTSAKYRPTLYDLLANRMLDFHKINRWYVTRPKQRFNISDPVVFKPTKEFSKEDFYTVDSIYSKRNVLKLYQTLELFHIKTDTTAYIDVLLGRLNFSRKNTSIKHKDSLYIMALQKAAKLFSNHEASSVIEFEMAEFYYKASKRHGAKKDSNLKNYRIKSHVICESVINKFPNSDGGLLCKILKNSIENKTLTISTEKYQIPNKPFLGRVVFKSVDSLYISIYKVPYNYFDGSYGSIRDSIVSNFIKNNKPLKTTYYKLQPKKDFYEYSTEIVLPELSEGNYLIAATKIKDISTIQHIYGYDMLSASNLTMLSFSKDENQVLRFLNRENGSPIEDVSIKINDAEKIIKQGKTNKFGEFYIKKDKKYHNEISILASHKGDTLLKSNHYIERTYNQDENDEERVAKMTLVLDRSIYRPGQTMYFKGFLIEKKKGKSKVVPNTYVYVGIYDANGDELKEYRLKTNAFGTINGAYKIPLNILTGEFTIEMDEDYGDDENDEDPYWEKIDDFVYVEIEFSVEEYKRPKFEVLFDDITENYKLEDSISVIGYGKAFLGSNISNAKVSYSIYRSVASSLSRSYYYDTGQIIKSGETTTDDKGKFEIAFIAVPDSLFLKNDKPVFSYRIATDITDINGETQSQEKSINIGYHNLKVDLLMANKLKSNEPQKIKINTENLNGQAVSAVVDLAIYKLTEPDRVLRKKPWELVDLQSIPKNTFLKLFPNEVYDSLDLKKNWTKGTKLYSKKLNTSSSNTVNLEDISKWESGAYVLETKAIDVFNDTLYSKKRFEIYNSDNSITKSKLFDYEIVNSQFKADKEVLLKLSTATNNLNVMVEGYYKGKAIYKQSISIKNKNELVNIPIQNFYTDKIDINVSFVKYNSLYTDQFIVNFPELDNELSIQTLSFRNKLIPDQKETWSFKITNAKGEHAQAEILASMYDMSLDKLKPHSWNTNIGFGNQYYYVNAPRIMSQSFETSAFYNINRPVIHNASFVFKNYHNLKWFGFNFGDVSYENKKYLNNLAFQIAPKAQIEGNISGIITDQQGLPLPGVNVLVKGTSLGAQSDFDGFYTINASVDSKLVYSYLGFNTIEVTLIKDGAVNIAMTEDAATLDEVVVTALGIKKDKRALGYAVSYWTPKNVSDDIESKLGGMAAGIQIEQAKGLTGSSSQISIRGMASVSSANKPLIIVDGVLMNLDESEINLSPGDIQSIDVLKGAAATSLYGVRGKNGVIIITTKKGIEALVQVEARSDLKENAFFFPHLTTNKKGEVSFSFNAPQALTKWRFMLVAHNKNLEVGALEKIAVTQKDLNVIPNAPRFLREMDTIILSAKISNLTSDALTGISQLQLFDPITMDPIDAELMNNSKVKRFTIRPKGNSSVSWKLVIPEGLQALQYKIIAKSGSHSDGESNVLPVLSNRILITEAKPIWVQSGKSKQIEFEKLKNQNSSTRKNHKFTLEYTSNPAWLAIKSLPYLMEFPHECAEQTFAKYYSNALAATIVNDNEKVKAVFDSWKSEGSSESAFDKNENLKSILISETPWVRDALSEKENKSRLANLFEKERLIEQQLQAINKLKQLQLSSGGFPWFSGGRESEFITRHIVSGFGHLKKLNIQSENSYKVKPILKKAISYLDSEFIKDYYKEVGETLDSSKVSLQHNTIQYLYSRSFYLDTHPLPNKLKKIIDTYIKASKNNWVTQALYDKGMLALFLYRMDEKETAKDILEALKEQAVHSDENGMYWKENTNSWYWYGAPIETQALLIEAFVEIENDDNIIDSLKLWLLKNKQTNRWSTTKATTEAIYALLMNGSDWLSVSDNTVITIGDEKIKTSKLKSTEKEAGTGYMKIGWNENEINSKMASVKITNKSNVTGYGGVYWQYFEDLDKVTTSDESPLHIKKAMFLKKTTNSGKSLIPIEMGTPIQIGDLITVRIEITSENDMEFIHLKDLRSSGLEPIDVLSEYKWQDGLGYYQSTKDVATHFFFDRLPKGTYVFEYDLRANNSGNFSNGITTIQSMYAPEFTDYSKGTRINIKE